MPSVCHCKSWTASTGPLHCDLSGHLNQLLKSHGNGKVVTAMSDLFTDISYVVDTH